MGVKVEEYSKSMWNNLCSGSVRVDEVMMVGVLHGDDSCGVGLCSTLQR